MRLKHPAKDPLDRPTTGKHHAVMIKHNLTIIYRNILKRKGTFLINLLGLSMGLSCAFIIFLWVYDELHVDKFHSNENRIFQVMENLRRPEGIVTTSNTPALLAETIAAELPEVVAAMTSTPKDFFPKFTFSYKGRNVKAAGKFADANHFEIFSYPLTRGNSKNVLTNKNSIVISEKLADNLFGSTIDVVGQKIEWKLPGLARQSLVSGVFKDIPGNSTDQFDFVIPFLNFREIMGMPQTMDSLGPFNTYVVLREGVSQETFNQKIAGFIRGKFRNANVTLFVRKYSDQYLHGSYENGVQAGGRMEYVVLFSVVAAFILLIACINFMNLSTATASVKWKEVGVKKAVGAGRKSLVIQYLSESVAMSFLALFLAILFTGLIIPSFNSLTGKQLDIGATEPVVFLVLVGITLFTGLLAGSYPAFYLSGFNPVRILKGTVQTSVSELWMRKGLVVFQFSLSIVFIISVLVIYEQIRFIQYKNLGFDRDNILQFETEGRVAEHPDQFIASLKGIRGVENVTGLMGSFITTYQGMGGELSWKGKKVAVQSLGVQYDFVETMGMQMKDGRSFKRDLNDENFKIILNEAAVKALGLNDPVGKQLVSAGPGVQIIGVVKDFNSQSLRSEVKPMSFRIDPTISTIMVKIEGKEQANVLAEIQELYKNYNPGFVLDYKFMDTDYQHLYESENRIFVLSGYFAGLAILISCLGLLGLASFTAEKRKKEIGIRKVLGASVSKIAGLLSRDFLILVAVAFIVAAPAAYFLMSKWLGGFAYKVNIPLGIFILVAFLVALLTLATVGFQAVKAALMNPVRSLKSE
ncbi:hypothetical protein DYBT9275_03167 [Dyadobacter sp. CECT 9275]|uniref:FtsX-like permease family protein n=1 Tax=Dyadobacter helix TaxID=2822344 RepID=A0A916JC61_9BACT|nr:ABC transporter permease [Dyadobacter sp. CECT 9275]CAG5003504.1 hypothetical protein DYBT9275_03167 [Dyadobacter sp. CECT 9275]